MKLIAYLLLVFAAFNVAAQDPSRVGANGGPVTLQYEPHVVTLVGTLLTSTGETPDGAAVKYPSIRLNKPISVDPTDDEPSEKGVLLLQLAMTPEQFKDFNRLKGKSAAVTGKLFHSDNGHHMTNVLVTVDSIAAPRK